MVVIEAQHVAAGASGRNGGFVSPSLTHGLAHGHALWRDEMPDLLRLGRENLLEIEEFLAKEEIAADLRLCGKTMFATRPHEVDALRESHRLHQQYGEESVFLAADQARADVELADLRRWPDAVGGRAGRPGRSRDRAPGRGAAQGRRAARGHRRCGRSAGTAPGSAA